MPRNLAGCGRHPPQPRYHAFAFYSAVRLGDPEMLARIMTVDPYFVTQDNGAGAPIHFAVTYRQLDMVHHLLNLGAHVNQRDPRGLTPLHRAAHLAHLDGYLELYEYLLSRGADPTITSDDFDPYLDPGPKTPAVMAPPDARVRAALAALESAYADVPKAPRAHPDLGDWWALYDYGPEVVAAWPHDYCHPYPEEEARRRAQAERRAEKLERRQLREAYLAALAAGGDGSEVVAAAEEKKKQQQAEKQQAAASAASAAAAAAGKAAGPSGSVPGPASAPATAASGGASTSAVAAPRPPPPAAVAAASAAVTPAVPKGRVAFVFPGQGSQAVGMLSAAASLPAVAAMLDTARAVLGYDLEELCRNGPQSALDDTRVAQPALFMAGLAAVELLRSRDPQLVAAAEAGGSSSSAGGSGSSTGGCVCAGLSLGEYTALVFAGALTFEEGLRVVKARGEAMAAAAAAGAGARPHGMLSVVGLGDARLGEVVAAALAGAAPGSVCQVANYLFPQGRVVSGHRDVLEVVRAGALAAGALKATILAVSGAFHTPLMAPAREQLLQALDAVQLRPPRLPVLSNVTAQPFPPDPAAIRELLGRQLVEPVQWEACLAALLAPPAGPGAPESGGVALWELGPGQQIKAMVKRLSLEAWRGMGNVAP
ncbi:hypothetical protein CHLRE_02g088250v5 [Chlamydomonas reinhardtii]|uniref:Malonyl-CoA:ACP transacylase (MAT) domain-containing protein n=1 Tax=Chlamydomonas reinhardtii TaxID=3055 RepID=A0A2K3E123_CHLRE|nr:uncharacterized protein CHLRE_02g088250v5 [Chlamydomonas reinhardtii]PNW86481.1 hypothetical protein CHLRE_02g088250v5 [Chlamydomonas reinhardtii]